MSEPNAPPPRAWQRMLSGRRLDLLDPSPDDVDIADIAHGLARVARWNGQTVGPHAFSVAQHVLIVEDIAHALHPAWPRQWRLAALLHDAAEYVIGDLISPFKSAIGLDYKAFEQRLLDAIHTRFALPSPLPDDISRGIKHADKIAAYFEATRLAGFAISEAERFFGTPNGLPEGLVKELDTLTAVSASTAQQCFMERFRTLAE